jgi:hypothetical protein
MGRGVSSAFGHHRTVPFLEQFRCWDGDYDYIIVPHPSGVNQFYNNRDNIARARELLSSLWVDEANVDPCLETLTGA